jgi:hypothetical protein
MITKKYYKIYNVIKDAKLPDRYEVYCLAETHSRQLKFIYTYQSEDSTYAGEYLKQDVSNYGWTLSYTYADRIKQELTKEEFDNERFVGAL